MIILLGMNQPTLVLEATGNMASVRDTMTLLDVSRPTVLKYLSDGKFPGAVKREGATGEWDIPREDVEAVRQERIIALRREISKLEKLAEFG